MKKILIGICAVFFLSIGQAWGEIITVVFHGEIGRYEDRLSVEIFPLTIVGELKYDDADGSLIGAELTKMYVNDQRLYGGWIGKGSVFSAAYQGIVEAVAFEMREEDVFTDPNNDRATIGAYPSYFDLVLYPPGTWVGGYRDPPNGLYNSFDKRMWDSSYGDQWWNWVYKIDERIAVIENGLEGPWRLVSGWGTYDFGPVPEPATMLLLGTGLIGLAVIGRKRFKK